MDKKRTKTKHRRRKCEDSSLKWNKSPPIETKVNYQSERSGVTGCCDTFTGIAGGQGKGDLRPSRVDVPCREQPIFPAWTVAVVGIATLIIRIRIVCDRSHWWILHPDEIFQGVEVAHSEVFGYGFRPYEYLSPPPANSSSPVEKQEADLGMYSLRSFMYPQIFAIVFVIADKLGKDWSPFQVSRIFHATVSAHLPFSVYIFANVIFANKDVANLAAIFTLLSVHLTVLGTHTLINSLLSPFVIYASAQAIYLVHKLQTPSPTPASVVSYPKYDGVCNRKCVLENNNSHSFLNEKVNILNNERLPTREVEHTITRRKTTMCKLKLFLTGVGSGVLCYLRLDSIVVFIFVVIPFTLLQKTSAFHTFIKSLMPFVLGGLLGLSIGGFVDRRTYGAWFLTPIQWVKFNVLSDHASVLFGLTDSMEYIRIVLLRDWFIAVSCCVIPMCAIGASLFMQTKKLTRLAICVKPLYVILFSTCSLIFVYSCQGHKEIRFLHNAIVFLWICSSVSFVYLLQWVPVYKRHVAVVIIIIGSMNLYREMPSQKDKSNAEWSFLGVWDSGYINECLHFIGRQSDVTGVFSGRSLHMTGGYTALHKDVPIISLVHYEFQEFSEQSREVVHINTMFAPRSLTRPSVVNRVSNFISVDNMKYLVKYLISNAQYNYALIHKNKKFIKIGYTKVYEAGTMQVLKRNNDAYSNTELQSYGNSISPASNGTVLEYEGSWLITLGLHDLAKARLKDAIRADPGRIRAYQLLAILYQNEGDNENLRSILTDCYVNNSKQICNTPQPKVVLYKNYKINMLLKS